MTSTPAISASTTARPEAPRASPTASVYYPAMNGFGSLGINPTMFAWYEVFGVDPSNSSHLIAPDIFNQKIMETHDGGDNWSEIPLLTGAVSDGGRFNFGNWVFPHASAVSFNPEHPTSLLYEKHGSVYNLKEVPDFAGTYTVATPAVTASVGGSDNSRVYQNDKGVIVRITGRFVSGALGMTGNFDVRLIKNDFTVTLRAF